MDLSLEYFLSWLRYLWGFGKLYHFSENIRFIFSITEDISIVFVKSGLMKPNLGGWPLPYWSSPTEDPDHHVQNDRKQQSVCISVILVRDHGL